MTTLDLNRLAKEVREFREEMGWSQAALAENGGPSTTTTSKIERAELDPIPHQTRRKLEIAFGWAEGSVKNILAGGDPTPQGINPSTAPHEAPFARLNREADEAQAEFEKAVGELVAAEARVDAANRQVFRWIAMRGKIEEEADRRAQQLGRPLNQIELLTIDDVERPHEEEIAELLESHAMNSPHEWTRYEMALVEVLEPGPKKVTSGSRFADLEIARSKVRRLNLPEWRAKRNALEAAVQNYGDGVPDVAHHAFHGGEVIDFVPSDADNYGLSVEGPRLPDKDLPKVANRPPVGESKDNPPQGDA